ncbi:MAG: gluconolactonase [Firmicutes bacterium]|nr:gluconolactonase [Bacillota bacterium]
MQAKLLRCLVLALIIAGCFACLPPAVQARLPYHTYTYDYWGDVVYSPAAYLPNRLITGEDLGIGALRTPTDLFIGKDGKIYILDAGNGRIVVTNDRWELVRVIDGFEKNGVPDRFNEPNGFFVTEEGHIYVADTGNGRLVELDPEGNFLREIGPPQSDIIPDDFTYRPTKLVVDRAGRIYVVARHVNQGLIELTPDGAFRSYMGASRVALNMVDYFWKMIATREQRERMALFVPTEYNNLCIDDEGFIFVTTSALNEWDIQRSIDSRSEDDRYAPVRRLNLMGNDILRRRGYFPPVGDILIARKGSVRGPSMLVDVAVDDEVRVYSVLDRRRGRIFTYDSEGNLLYIFGAIGERFGNFRNPVALDYLGEKILVLDYETGTVTEFAVTAYGRLIREAVHLHFIGKYDEAAACWEEVLLQNANYEMAYVGIGRAFLRQGKYEEAMKNFKLGNHRKYYSRAFYYHRREVIGRNFGLIVGILAAFVLALYITIRVREKRRGSAYGEYGSEVGGS